MDIAVDRKRRLDLRHIPREQEDTVCSIRNRPVDKLVRLCRGTSSGSSFIPTSQRNYLGYTSPRLANEHALPPLLLVKRDTLILLVFLSPRSSAMGDFRADQHSAALIGVAY